MRRSTGLTLSLMICVFVGFAMVSKNVSKAATTDTTIVTIAPNTPDDFLNLYPDLSNEELAELPSVGASIESIAGLGLLIFGILAVAATAAVLQRTRQHRGLD
jgi:hypothetical protein